MISLRLHDSNFTGSESSSLYHPPKRFAWARYGIDTPVTFYTDLHLETARSAKPGTFRVAWILEPSAINPDPYRYVVANQDSFDLILVHHSEFLKYGDKFVWYPNGMSWIATPDWRQHEKHDGISIVASNKKMTEGHNLRHEVIAVTAGKLKVFGRGYTPVEHKVEALGPYRFSVVIENSRAPWYFTEKLLDCFATHTVPIYWGCPGIAKFFDTTGMCVVSSKEDIVKSIDFLNYKNNNEAVYKQMLPFVTANHEKAKRYAVAEDWIFDNIITPRGLAGGEVTVNSIAAGND